MTKKPSGERSSVHQRRSYSSMSLVNRPALFASVRAMRIVSTSHTSAASRAAISLAMNSPHVGREPRRDQFGDELARGHEHLPAQMPTFLDRGELVLEMHAGRARRD